MFDLPLKLLFEGPRLACAWHPPHFVRVVELGEDPHDLILSGGPRSEPPFVLSFFNNAGVLVDSQPQLKGFGVSGRSPIGPLQGSHPMRQPLELEIFLRLRPIGADESPKFDLQFCQVARLPAVGQQYGQHLPVFLLDEAAQQNPIVLGDLCS